MDVAKEISKGLADRIVIAKASRMISTSRLTLIPSQGERLRLGPRAPSRRELQSRIAGL